MFRTIAATALLTLAGCAANEIQPAESPQPERPSLTGDWLLTLSAGYVYVVRIHHVEGATYRMSHDHVNLNTNGVYRREDDRLRIVEPACRRRTEFEWQIETPVQLRLIASPPTAKVGSDYTGATLQRLSSTPGEIAAVHKVGAAREKAE